MKEEGKGKRPGRDGLGWERKRTRAEARGGAGLREAFWGVPGSAPPGMLKTVRINSSCWAVAMGVLRWAGGNLLYLRREPTSGWCNVEQWRILAPVPFLHWALVHIWLIEIVRHRPTTANQLQ